MSLNLISSVYDKISLQQIFELMLQKNHQSTKKRHHATAIVEKLKNGIVGKKTE